MTPEFSRAVDGVFLCVLDLLSRIECNEADDPSDERIRIRGQLDQAQAMLGQTTEWELAKYGLVAWTDEVLIEAEWPGRRWWVENALEHEFFQTLDAHSNFYVRAVEAGKLPSRNALEVFYVCVMLGFRGLYRDVAGAALAPQLGMPPDLETWVARTALAIKLGHARPPLTESARQSRSNAPLEGKYRVVRMLLISLVLSAIALFVAYMVFRPGGSATQQPEGDAAMLAPIHARPIYARPIHARANYARQGGPTAS